ncbi:MAG: hypothetical protein RMH75_01440 [Archaeoglobaceae archaeon]|nr:hypothetical protein [Archaeoglobaceae archaeon]MDW7989324.1 hypothetical protein [Archaeoglobaceae archaeon]
MKIAPMSLWLKERIKKYGESVRAKDVISNQKVVSLPIKKLLKES